MASKPLDPGYSGGKKYGPFSDSDIKKIQAEVTKPKGTQPGHAVTHNDNHTSPLTKKKADDAEKKLQQKLKSGKDLNKAREDVANKTGVWPNGYTN